MRFRYQITRAAMILAVALATAPMGFTQNNCKTFRAAIQANWMDVQVDQTSLVLPILQASWTNPTNPASPAIPSPPQDVFGWAGPFAGTLDGQVVVGYFSSWLSSAPTQNGVAGKEGKVNSKLDFGKDGYLITVSDNKGVFPMPPGHGGFGAYAESSKVTGGSGTFLNASGHVSYSGPWIWYQTTSAPPSPTAPGSGIWHAEINGRVCTVP